MKRKKGQTLIEFALLVPILLTVLIAIFEFGMIFNAYLQMQTAARDGARLLSLGETDSNTTSLINGQVVGLDLAQLTISISPSQASRTSGNQVTVSLSYQHDVITPLMAVFIGNTLTLNVQSTMRVE